LDGRKNFTDGDIELARRLVEMLEED